MLRYAAADRNVGPIGDILAQYFKNGFKVLEVASGTGQHSVALADRFPQVIIQPSEVDARLIHSIVGYVDHHRVGVDKSIQIAEGVLQLPNLRVPLHVDVSTPASGWALPADFSPSSIDSILAINICHISSEAAVHGLFQAAGWLLRPSTGLLIVYGPFAQGGRVFPQSNVDFDRGLRVQNREWGLRDTDDLEKLAEANGLHLSATHEMPANNLTLVFSRP